MILSTTDLEYLSQCPKKWIHNPPQEKISPIQVLLKRTVLSRTLGRQYQWDLSGISNIWDETFWSGREMTRENIDLSIKGVLATKRIYDKFLSNNFDAYPTELLSSSISSDVIIKSSGDFLLQFEDHFETWIHRKMKISTLLSSVMAIGESYLAFTKIRSARQMPLRVVTYYESEKGINPIVIGTYPDISEHESEKIVVHLSNLAKKKVLITTAGPWCNNCEVSCVI